jgi:hypothetical protein
VTGGVRIGVGNHFETVHYVTVLNWCLTPILDDIADGGDTAPFVEAILTSQARETGRKYALDAAEEFRIVRFGGLSEMLEAFGRRI